MLKRSDRPCAASQAPVARKKSQIMQAIYLPRTNRSYVWARCSSTLTPLRKYTLEIIFCSANAIFASSVSKSGNLALQLAATFKRSSVDFAISTSLIQDIVIVGCDEFAHDSVLKLTLQHGRSTDSRIFPEMQFRDWMSRIFRHTILRVSSSSTIYRYSSWMIPPGKSWGVGMVDPSGFRLTPSLKILPVSLCLDPNENDAKNIRRMLRKVLLDQVFQKRFLRYPMSSVHHAASKDRGWSFLGDSNYVWVDWERGILQSCSQCQDRKNLLRRKRNSPCSAGPESESRADSQWKGFLSCCKTTHQFSMGLSVSSKQILRNSTCYWQSFPWFSWNILFHISNTPNKLIFSVFYDTCYGCTQWGKQVKKKEKPAP